MTDLLCKKRKTFQGRLPDRKGHVKTQQEGGHLQVRQQGTSRETKLVTTLIRNFYPPELWDSEFLFKPPVSAHQLQQLWRTNPVGLGWAQEFAFLTSPQMLPGWLDYTLWTSGLANLRLVLKNYDKLLIWYFLSWVKLSDLSFFLSSPCAPPPYFWGSRCLSKNPNSELRNKNSLVKKEDKNKRAWVADFVQGWQ